MYGALRLLGYVQSHSFDSYVRMLLLSGLSSASYIAVDVTLLSIYAIMRYLIDDVYWCMTLGTTACKQIQSHW